MTATPEIWISIASTERPASLRRLTSDLAEQSDEIGCRLRLFVIENGRTAAARCATADALADFSSARRSLQIEPATTAGGSIADSRRNQRDQVRRALGSTSPPGIVWMLDDDLRLEHRIIDSGRLLTRRLHNHLRFLIDVKRQHPELEVLLGEVSGDPPIPPVATYASRLEDFAASLRSMSALAPSAPWHVSIEIQDLCDDDYYDFAAGSTRDDAVRPRMWIPTTASVRVADVLAEMVNEACDIPFGIGFSRPIIANERAFGRLRDDTIRGGHAAFFSPDAFTTQRYPSLRIADIETRRSDTLASALFAIAHPGRLRRSGFTVHHVRPRDERALPSADDLARNLISDTWGAALTRAIINDEPITNFLTTRAAQIDAAFARTRVAISQVRDLAAAMPPWARAPHIAWDRLDARLDWLLDTVPGLRQAMLPARWRDVLMRHEHALVDFARRLRRDPHAE